MAQGPPGAPVAGSLWGEPPGQCGSSCVPGSAHVQSEMPGTWGRKQQLEEGLVAEVPEACCYGDHCLWLCSDWVGASQVSLICYQPEPPGTRQLYPASLFKEQKQLKGLDPRTVLEVPTSLRWPQG